jgi:CheY-like chemotaxis protein
VSRTLAIIANELRMQILLVEDEPDVRGFLARALGIIRPHAGIVAVADGAAALAAFARSSADLIISDQHMPHMTGIELLRAIRRASDVPFILISADNAVAAAAVAAGASWFLPKPCSLGALRRAVEALAPIA